MYIRCSNQFRDTQHLPHFLKANGQSSSSSDLASVTESDLRFAIDDLLRSKAVSKAPKTSAFSAALDGSQQSEFAFMQSPPVTAWPQATVTEVEQATASNAQTAAQLPVVDAPTAGGFDGLSKEFLSAMQDSLENLGYDLTRTNIIQELLNDASLPDTLLGYMSSMLGGIDTTLLREMIRQWKQALEQQLEQEKQAATKKQRPVWRCSVCGRYGCPVAPYIESYVEVD